jgi:hypothetical protein
VGYGDLGGRDMPQGSRLVADGYLIRGGLFKDAH